MAKKYYVKDGELGGIEREYVESEKKAEVGDLIVVTEAKKDYEFYDVGHVGKVVLSRGDGDIRVNFEGFGNSFEFSDFERSVEWFVGYGQESSYSTLVPTGNVRIDGEIFRMVVRKAQVGERVIIVKNTSHGFSEGYIGEVSGSSPHEDHAVIDDEFGHYHWDYHVLEPVETPVKSALSTADLLANLSREVVRLRKKVAALEEQADSNAKDIVTFAEEATEAKKLADKVSEKQSEIVDVLVTTAKKMDKDKAEQDAWNEVLYKRTRPDGTAETVLGKYSGKYETLEERLQRADAEDLAHNVARFVSDYLKEGLRYERNN